MFDIGFPEHWSTLKKLMWLRAMSGGAAYETVSGAIASFETLRAAPLKELLVDINPVQAGSGDPSYPDNVRAISGWVKSVVSQGRPATTTLSTGTLNKDTGAETSSTSYKRTDYIPVEPGSVMRVSYHMPSGSWYFTACFYSDDSGTFLSSYRKSHSTSYDYTELLSIPPTCTHVRFALKSSYSNLHIWTDYTEIEEAFPTPPGTVYGGTLDVLSGVLESCPYYASYNGEALVGPWISSMDVYAPGATPTAGAQVVDLGGAKTVYQLDPVALITLKGQNYLWADTGDVTVTYRSN